MGEEREPLKQDIKPEYEFNFAEMELSTEITDMHQEGNFLVGMTDKGVRFRQHIPQGKVLDKIDGKYVLKSAEIVQSS